MREHLVFIKKGGGEKFYIHSDKIASMLDGKREAPKVSHVRFDEPKQEWFAILRDGREIARHKERDVVVVAEAEIINQMFAAREFIPGGFHISPLFDISCLPRMSDSGYLRYVGCHKAGETGLVYDIYIPGSAEFFMAVRKDDNSLVAITSTVPEESMSGPGIQVTMPQDDADHDAIKEAVRRFKVEEEIKKTEERKCQPT
jgi:hypothetical protein